MGHNGNGEMGINVIETRNLQQQTYKIRKKGKVLKFQEKNRPNFGLTTVFLALSGISC